MKGLSPSRRLGVYLKTSGFCAYCNGAVTLATFAVDHVHPRAHGGRNAMHNLLPVCRTCNASKGTKSLEDFRLFMAAKAVTGEVVFGDRQLKYLRDTGALPLLGIDPSMRFPFELVESGVCA